MNAFITKAAKFLPGNPISNDEMESYLGMVNGKPSKARRIVLRRNGIKTRYYALDKQGHATYTNAEMAANSVRGLFDEHFSIDDIDVLACGTASPESLVPSHGVQVHGLLGGHRTAEVVSFAGSCCAGADALKYAAMAVQCDSTLNAVASASERLSAWMRADYFQKESERLSQLEDHPLLAFEEEFLRWMLSDGAFSLLIQGQPAEKDLSLCIDWIEITSFANTQEVCMYAGGEKDTEGNYHGWADFPQSEWLSRSLFAVKQDTRLLGKYIVPLGVDYALELFKKHNLNPDDVDWFMPHVSSMYFAEKIQEGCKARGFCFPKEKWFINLPRIGNVASASAFAMIEDIMHSGMLKKGQKLLLMVPESARFSYCYCLMTVC